jgi:hypothetical protein
MQLAEAVQERPQGYGQRPQAAVESLQSASLAPPPCGHFVSAQYEADCARFLAETKRLARRRAEAALGRTSAAC